MRTIFALSGVVLIAVGAAAIFYKGFSYTTHENIAELGALKITAQDKRTVQFPPVLGGISVGAGLLVIAAAGFTRRKKIKHSRH